MRRLSCFFLAAVIFLLPTNAMSDDATLQLTLRSRAKADGKEAFKVAENKAAWDPKKTTLIICDMWDDHWCKSAARRVGELAVQLRLNLFTLPPDQQPFAEPYFWAAFTISGKG